MSCGLYVKGLIIEGLYDGGLFWLLLGLVLGLNEAFKVVRVIVKVMVTRHG